MVSKHYQQIQFYVMGHYSAPARKNATDDELKRIVEHIRFHNGDSQIIIGGDLNRSVKDVLTLAANSNLSICQDQADILITHEVAKLEKKIENRLDYLLSNHEWNQTKADPLFKISDHYPLNSQFIFKNAA